MQSSKSSFHILLIGFAVLILHLPLSGKTIRVATLNCHNYLITNRMVEGVYRRNYPKPEKDKMALRQIIREIQADVVVLQEIGGEPFLRELIRDLEMEGMIYQHNALSVGVDEVRFNAILSRLPVSKVNRISDLDFKYFEGREIVKRGLLEVIFSDGEEEAWSLYVVHLKSNLTEREDDPNSVIRRIGEAKAIRDYILSVHPDPTSSKFLILGDFNDSKASAPLRRFYKRSKVKISIPINAEDSRGEKWTYFYNRQDSYTRVDYILASPAMILHLVPDSGTIYDEAIMGEASDHRLVHADFEMTP